MTQIEKIDKKIFCLNMRMEGDKRAIIELEKIKKTMADNQIIRKNPEIVLTAMSMLTSLGVDQLLTQNRKTDLVFCRMIMAHRLFEAKMGPTAVGKILNRDHSSAIHLREQFKIDIRYSEVLKNKNGRFEEVLEMLLATHKN